MTVSCSAPAYDSSGNPVGSVTGELTAAMVSPGDCSDTLTPGISSVEQRGLAFILTSGTSGMNFSFEVDTPADFVQAEGYGEDFLVQLCAP